MNNKAEALKKLKEAEHLAPSFDEQFIIFRYITKIEEGIGEASGESKNPGHLDVI